MPPIAYLEISDFTPSGDLVPKLTKKPVFVMIQAEYCGHCQSAKPAFQALANEGLLTCMTIQADGARQGEKDLAKMLDVIYKGFRGFPSYMLFINGNRIPYTGGRTLQEMKQFLKSYL